MGSPTPLPVTDKWAAVRAQIRDLTAPKTSPAPAPQPLSPDRRPT